MVEPPLPVLVVGAGPAGLGLACELGWRRVPCVVIEQRAEGIDFPTANLINTRTMEHLRRWGLVDRIRDAGFPPDWPRTFLFVTRLGGHELARFEHPGNGQPPLDSAFSPVARAWVPKFFFDPVLRQHARGLPGVQFRFGCRLESFSQDAEGVTAQVADSHSGERSEIRASWLVAGDGGGSTVRRQLGIELRGDFSQGHNLAIYFRAPGLLGAHGHGKAVQYWYVKPGLRPTIIAIDGGQSWRYNLLVMPGQEVDPERLVADALPPGVPFQVLDTKPWDGHRVVADCFRDGRVFLAGDAAHLRWPNGGFGMNTTIGDAVDLGWKLAAVYQGWAGPRLLDSYQLERRPVVSRNTDEAASIFRADVEIPIAPEIEDGSPAGEAARAKAREFILTTRSDEFADDSPWIDLGYRYDGSPIVVSDGSPPPAARPGRFAQSARPGCRAPHAYLADGRSTLDLFGAGFVLLDFSRGRADLSGFQATARSAGVPLATVPLEDEAACEAYERQLVLVRPDGHVAWRGDDPPRDARRIIDVVRGA